MRGRELDREGLIAALCGVHRLETGVLPPLGFSPEQRVGTRSSLVLAYGPRAELTSVRCIEPAPRRAAALALEGPR